MLVLSSETASILMRTTCWLQLLEHLVQHARLGPAAHARVDRVPVAEPIGKPAPLAALFGHVQHGIDGLQIGHADVASLLGQTRFDKGELRGTDFHELPLAHWRYQGN